VDTGAFARVFGGGSQKDGHFLPKNSAAGGRIYVGVDPHPRWIETLLLVLGSAKSSGLEISKKKWHSRSRAICELTRLEAGAAESDVCGRVRGVADHRQSSRLELCERWGEGNVNRARLSNSESSAANWTIG